MEKINTHNSPKSEHTFSLHLSHFICVYNMKRVLDSSKQNVQFNFLQVLKQLAMFLGVHVLSRFSHVRFSETPWTQQTPLSMGFSRQEYWSGLPCSPPGDLPDPGIEPISPVTSALQADSLLLSHQGSLLLHIAYIELKKQKKQNKKTFFCRMDSSILVLWGKTIWKPLAPSRKN